MMRQPLSVRRAIPKHNEQASAGGDHLRLYEVPAYTQPRQHADGRLYRGEVPFNK